MIKIDHEIKTFEERKEELIKKGEKQGYITFEELAEALKELDLKADDLDDLYNALVDAGITVISEDETSDVDGGFAKEKIEEEPILLDDAEITKDVNINDPVRMYLKEIGRISLLSSEDDQYTWLKLLIKW